jgi:hypothetical protein
LIRRHGPVFQQDRASLKTLERHSPRSEATARQRANLAVFNTLAASGEAALMAQSGGIVWLHN